MGNIEVIINGNNVVLKSSETVFDMVKERNISGEMFVIEHNKEVVSKDNYKKTKIKNGDKFEIVGFFGGG